MRKQIGFTLIELIIFIIVISILGSAIMMAFTNVLLGVPTVLQQVTAMKTAEQCMEWYIGQRYQQGFASIPVGSSVASYCTAPSGYSIAVTTASNSFNSDSNYKLITVTVSGLGSASLTADVADY